jgi:hypothetical protein
LAGGAESGEGGGAESKLEVGVGKDSGSLRAKREK